MINAINKLFRLNHSSTIPSNVTFFIDLAGYLAVIFLIREVYFSEFNFIANGLFWSFTTLVFASWRMRVRQISWKDLGLCMPDDLMKALIATVATLALTILLIILFEIFKDVIETPLSVDKSDEQAASKFGELKDNWWLFLSLIPFIWLQSCLEEMLDRGFLLTWIEKTLSSTIFAMVIAVVLQALIFGFRHSYDISERSITVALIGLAMGICYVAFGRNLWPLIIAHCVLNTISMIERV
ncbi:CPBP family intramembrane glutamic endopeptidase [Microbulbifer sp. 2201CG32-9]|uniref:CPBP family intramembrane glutamic endopeptidase n=1 Tax=Microbulbifer sp. 2201CG32-9 TaxID=3232309 RepID=UPI00345C1152